MLIKIRGECPLPARTGIPRAAPGPGPHYERNSTRRRVSPMTRSPLGRLVSHLYRTVSSDQSPDADLLGRLVTHHDEAAFTALIQRHCAMVMAACRRVLGDGPDADDAFQATFLVLWRGAGRIRHG